MNDIELLIQRLNEDNWLNYIDDISKKIKPRIQKNGALKLIREKVNEDYKDEVAFLYSEFISNDSIINLDAQIKTLTNEILKINNLKNNAIYFEFFKYIKYIENHNNKFDDLIFIANLMEDINTDISLKLKLNSIVSQIINQSISQSNKSAAGGVGEAITEAILNKMGFVDGMQYKKQFKSKEGSDTDFVFPHVKDFDDINVQIFMAVQFSTNDRARLTSSELKTGGEKIALTYNDFPSSTKKLKDIGDQIVGNYKKERVRLVAYSQGIEKEIIRCKNNSKTNRLEYFQDYASSFEEYFGSLKNRFNV